MRDPGDIHELWLSMIGLCRNTVKTRSYAYYIGSTCAMSHLWSIYRRSVDEVWSILGMIPGWSADYSKIEQLMNICCFKQSKMLPKLSYVQVKSRHWERSGGSCTNRQCRRYTMTITSMSNAGPVRHVGKSSLQMLLFPGRRKANLPNSRYF